jgi:hypothetical protein
VVQLRGKPKEGVSIRIEIVRPGGTSLLRIDGSGQIGDGGGACETGNHGPFYQVLKDYQLQEGTPEYANAVAALLEFCRQLRSR